MTAQHAWIRRCAGCMTELPGGGTCPVCRWDDAAHAEIQDYLPSHYVLRNQYYIGRVLGQGGFGITYLAYDLTLARPVAIKEYFPDGLCSRLVDRSTVQIASDGPRDLYLYGMSRFLEEARVLALLGHHPCIVPVNAFIEANSTAYLVMPYLSGVTLKEYLGRQPGGRISAKLAVETLMPVMEALREVHMHGLLHRDISRDNILITDRGQVTLLDFGAARHAVGEMSQSLSVILKPGFAPEDQYRNNGRSGPWTDVYATTATLYRCLTGQTPPPAIDRLAEDALQPPSLLCPGIPSGIDAVVQKGMTLRASDRYQSIEQLQEAISRIDTAASEPAAETAVTKSLTREEARNGCVATIDVPGGGPIEVRIPAGVQSGTRLRLTGQAFGGGDLWLDLRIEEPTPTSAAPEFIPLYAMHDEGSVTLATLLGGPLAGSLLMAENYRNLEKGGAAAKIVALGVGAVGLTLLINQFVNFSGAGLGIAMLFAFRSWARRYQGAAVKAHIAAGGRIYSRWRAALVGLACSALIVGAVFAWIYAAEQINDPQVTIGNADNVHYIGDATKAQALDLGQALRNASYFQDRGVSVFLAKDAGGTTISFVVKEDNPDLSFAFESIALKCAPSVGGLPLTLRLVSQTHETLREFHIGSVPIEGNSHVYYIDSANEIDARMLARALRMQGSFNGRNADVFLSKRKGGTAVLIPVGEGAWNNSRQVNWLKQIVRCAAPSVGGLPVKLLLLDSSLEPQKDVMVY